MLSLPPKEGRLSKGFESLSSELHIAIIKQLPELISLDSLLRASPSAFRLFNNYGTEIMDIITSSNQIHGHVRAMIRLSGLIRTSTLPMNNLQEFRNRTTFSAMEERICSLKRNLSPLHFEKNTPPAILRGILASNRHITQLSLELLKTYLDHFRARKPRQLTATVSTDLLNLDSLLELSDNQWVKFPFKTSGLLPATKNIVSSAHSGAYSPFTT